MSLNPSKLWSICLTSRNLCFAVRSSHFSPDNRRKRTPIKVQVPCLAASGVSQSALCRRSAPPCGATPRRRSRRRSTKHDRYKRSHVLDSASLHARILPRGTCDARQSSAGLSEEGMPDWSRTIRDAADGREARKRRTHAPLSISPKQYCKKRGQEAVSQWAT